MTAETEIAAILNHATENADSLTESAQSLMSDAIAVISEPIGLPTMEKNNITVTLGQWVNPATFVPTGGSKPGMPPFPSIVIPPLPNLQTVATIDSQFDETLSALAFPTFLYESPRTAPVFAEADPLVDSAVALPSPPNTAFSSPPTLMSLHALSDVQFSIPETQFADIDVDLNFDKDFFTQQLALFSNSIMSGGHGVRGLDELLAELSAMSNQSLGALFTDFIDLIGQKLTDRYQNGVATAVESSIQQGLDAAIQAEALRVRTAMQDRSGWDLPALVQQALSAAMEQSMSAWAAQAQSQQTTDQWEHAQDVFELSATLYEKLRRTIQELKTRELEMVLEAHRQSIRYAQQVTDALLTVFTVENYQKYDLEFRKAESRLKLFEEQLKVQLAQYELVFAKLEMEKAKQEQDGLLVQQYQTELQQMAAENRLLSTQVSTARTELELKTLPVEIFELQIRAFGARVNAYESQVSALVAEISGNVARIEGEAAKIKGFEAQADAFIAQVNAAKAVIQAQKQRNDSVLEELQAKVKAAMAPIELSTAKAKYQLEIYEADAKDFLANAKAVLEKAKLDDAWRQEEQKGLFEAYKMTREQTLSIVSKRLQILKAIAEVNNEGAQIMAQMAGGAMSAANGIANVIFQESA